MAHLQAGYVRSMLFTVILTLIAFLVLTPTVSRSMPLISGGINIEYKRYCSNHLFEMIRLICGGRYNSLAHKYPESVGTRSYRSGPLKRSTPDDGIFYRPMQIGPVHECCAQPCGYSQLKTYCASD